MNRNLRVTRRTALLTGVAGAVSGVLLGPSGMDAERVLAAPEAATSHQQVDKSAVERALGKTGQMQSEGVLQFSLDRQDIHPVTENVGVPGSFFLGAEIFFKRYPSMTMAMVEIPLLGHEVNPSIQRTSAEGLTFTALHNHRIMMTPQVWWLHLMGMGNETALAASIRRVLPGQGSVFASGATSKQTSPLSAQTIGTILGGQMQVGDQGVVEVSVERTDTVSMNGVSVPSSFGIQHDIYFKPLNGSSTYAALTAELALAQQEVEPVSRQLENAGIQIAALHNHMINEQPRRFFLHIFAKGNAVTMAEAVRAALNSTKTEPGHGGAGKG